MNMEKRLLLALAFSFIVLAVWSNFTVKPKTAVNPQDFPQKALSVEKTSPGTLVPIVSSTPAPALTSAALFESQQGKRKFVFVEPQGAIKEVVFLGYQSYAFPLKNSLFSGDGNLAFTRQPHGNNGFTYSYEDGEKRISKQFDFSGSGYEFEVLLKVENLSGSPLALKLPVLLGTLDPATAKDRMSFHDVTIVDSEKILHPNFQKEASFNHLRFIALRDRYFCAIIEPSQSDSIGFIAKTPSKGSEVGILFPDLKIVPRGTWEQKFKVYIGPQDAKTLKAINPDWQSVIYFGKFDLIAQGLLMMLEVFYNIFHSWGWVIICLSLVIYLVLYPLTMKQMRSMKEMQLLQPKIEELRLQFKDNAQRLNKEIMELYRTHKVNPFSGCLPMILQIPIFFALYQVLTRSIALKGASFFWIKDLSEPDRLFLFPQSLPLIGNEFNILPILMAIEMFIQQKFSMTNVSPAQAEQQKIMLVIMPVMFGFLFYRMPSGLVLYWFINSSLTMAYQLRVAKAK
ncbi:MAG: membrane protein insertase YidC [Candidatus Omnitrophica bacterium]|nr:membrane protein insertase YidC [Candidatus Omnitrophota bacterium]